MIDFEKIYYGEIIADEDGQLAFIVELWDGKEGTRWFDAFLIVSDKYIGEKVEIKEKDWDKWHKFNGDLVVREGTVLQATKCESEGEWVEND